MEHGIVELVARDHLVVVFVHLIHDGVPQNCVLLVASVEHVFKLISADLSVTIGVEHPESDIQVLLAEQFCSVHGGRHEFGVVDLAIPVGIQLLDEFYPVGAVGL